MKSYKSGSYIFWTLFALFLCIDIAHAANFNELKCYYFDDDYLRQHPKPVVTCILNPSNGLEECDMGFRSYKMEAGSQWPTIKLFGTVRRVHHNSKASIITSKWVLKKYFTSTPCVGLLSAATIEKYKNVWTLTATSLTKRGHRTLYLECVLKPIEKVIKSNGDEEFVYNDLLPEASTLSGIHIWTAAGHNDSIFEVCPFKDDLEIDPVTDASSSSSGSGLDSSSSNSGPASGSSSSGGLGSSSSSSSTDPVTVHVEDSTDKGKSQ